MTEELEYLRATLVRQDIDVETVIAQVQTFPIETPSWGYGNSGTRFKVFP
jgi:L-rhamnose isomerase / sugar isomerase